MIASGSPVAYTEILQTCLFNKTTRRFNPGMGTLLKQRAETRERRNMLVLAVPIIKEPFEPRQVNVFQ